MSGYDNNYRSKQYCYIDKVTNEVLLRQSTM